MKNILRNSALIALTIFSAISCTNDNDAVARAEGGPVLLSPEAGSEVVLSPLNEDGQALSLIWDHADYDVATAVNYTVEIAPAGTSFSTVTEAGTTTNRFMTWSVQELNAAALDAGLIPYTASDLDIRIKATVGDGDLLVQYSEPITISVTPYSSELPKIAVPGNHQGWSPTSADVPLLASSGFGETDYEGFVWLDGEWKLLSPKPDGTFDWGTMDWGDDGTFSGTLKEQDEVNMDNPAGYYYVQADTEALTYSVQPTNWGIIGAATPGGWDNSTPLTYNPATKKWEGVVVMTAGPYKFRANNAWDINLGADNDDLDSSMNFGGPDIVLATGGTYTVSLDLSNPRNYTYSLTLN